MDSLPRFGRDITPAVIVPTFQLYGPLLAAQSGDITSTARTTFSYASSLRQTLDIYTPRKPAPEMENKILFFLYGGGFVQGDKIMKDLPLVHANVGHFFAENHGLETIIVDYRLVSHGARFPSGGVDLQAALGWVEDHYEGKNIFLLGTSAGAVHIATYLFGAEFKITRDKLLQGGNNKLAGVVLLSMPADSKGANPEMLRESARYFGEEVSMKEPMGLLQQAKRHGGLSLPHILVLDSELDADIVATQTPAFVQELEDSGALSVEYQQIKGHNHFSPCLALGTGIDREEEWGHKLISWLRK